MIPTTRRVLLLAALLALGACGSPKKGSSEAPSSATARCTCGTPQAAMNGCPHPLCAAGKTNPENHDCFCGPLPFGAEQD